jgi:hypothetical protein
MTGLIKLSEHVAFGARLALRLVIGLFPPGRASSAPGKSHTLVHFTGILSATILPDGGPTSLTDGARADCCSRSYRRAGLFSEARSLSCRLWVCFQNPTWQRTKRESDQILCTNYLLSITVNYTLLTTIPAASTLHQKKSDLTIVPHAAMFLQHVIGSKHHRSTTGFNPAPRMQYRARSNMNRIRTI